MKLGRWKSIDTLLTHYYVPQLALAEAVRAMPTGDSIAAVAAGDLRSLAGPRHAPWPQSRPEGVLIPGWPVPVQVAAVPASRALAFITADRARSTTLADDVAAMEAAALPTARSAKAPTAPVATRAVANLALAAAMGCNPSAHRFRVDQIVERTEGLDNGHVRIKAIHAFDPVFGCFMCSTVYIDGRGVDRPEGATFYTEVHPETDLKADPEFEALIHRVRAQPRGSRGALWGIVPIEGDRVSLRLQRKQSVLAAASRERGRPLSAAEALVATASDKLAQHREDGTTLQMPGPAIQLETTGRMIVPLVAEMFRAAMTATAQS
jgi:hypothetical protein